MASIESSLATPSVRVPHLRPLNMGRLLDHTIRLYRRNFGRFLGIAALVQLPMTAVGLLYSGSMMAQVDGLYQVDPAAAIFASGGYLVLVIVARFWMQFGAATLAQSASDTYLEAPSTLRTTIRRAGTSWLNVIGAYILMFLVAAVMFLLFIIPLFGWIAAIPGVGMFGYFGAVVTSLLVPIMVLEKRSVTGGIARAWNLARTRFWWSFGFFTLLYIFSLLVLQGPIYLLTGILSLVAEGVLSELTIVLLSSVISALLSVIYYPIAIIGATLVYYDLRIRHEGLDLALRALPPDGDGRDAVDTAVRTPPATSQGFRPTWGEVGAFSLITIGSFVVVFGFFFLMGLAFFPFIEGGF